MSSIEVRATFVFCNIASTLRGVEDAVEGVIADRLTNAGVGSVNPDDVTAVAAGTQSSAGPPTCFITLQITGGHLTAADDACCDAIAADIAECFPDGVGCEVKVGPASA